MAFTYGDAPDTVVGDAVRYLIGNTDANGSSKDISDGELMYSLARYGYTAIGNTYTATTSADAQKLLQAAAEVCEAWAAKFGPEASYAVGPMSEGANEKSKMVRVRALELRKLARVIAKPRVFGRSKADKTAAAGDADLVQPFFVRSMFANTTLDTR